MDKWKVSTTSNASFNIELHYHQIILIGILYISYIIVSFLSHKDKKNNLFVADNIEHF